MRRKNATIQPPDSVIEEDKTDIISKYITPDAKCICCNMPGIALKINQAYLNGMTYIKIIEEFGDAVYSKIGKKLDHNILSVHFTKHFNHKGVAIAEYNRRHGMSLLPAVERRGMVDIFSSLVERRVSDLELLDLAMKEQIKRLKELEDIKKKKIEENRTYNIDQIIMKQEAIVDNLSKNILGKLQIWQKARFQTKQMEVMDQQLQFLDYKTASFLGIDQSKVNLEPGLAKEAERVYLRVVIENIIKRTRDALDVVLSLSQQDKAQFFKELNRQFKGIEKDINDEFGEKLNNFKNVSLKGK